MNGEHKVSGSKRRTRAEVQKLVAEFGSSGMRRSEFCRSRGLSFGTLNRHLKKQRWKRRSRAASSAGRLLRLRFPGGQLYRHQKGVSPGRAIRRCAGQGRTESRRAVLIIGWD